MIFEMNHSWCAWHTIQNAVAFQIEVVDLNLISSKKVKIIDNEPVVTHCRQHANFVLPGS